MEPPRLLDLATKTLCDNIDKYDKDLVKTIIAPFRQKMLKEMLEMAENHYSKCDRQDDHVDKLWAMLPFLINSKLYTKLDTHDVSMYCPASSTMSNSRFQEFIRCLGANTPNLRELEINNPTRDVEYSLEERELDSIIQLRNLTILTIYQVHVPLSGILDISRRCEKLKRLEANYVRIDVESPSVTFRNDFVNVSIEKHYFKLGRLKLELNTTMPTWDPDGEHKTKLSLRPYKTSDFSLVKLFAEKLAEIEIDSYFLEDIEEMDEFPLLPQIKYATINCGGESAHALRCFMKRNGERLQELTLCEIDSKEKMSFGEIFSLCPNLQSLEMYLCILSGNDAPVDAMHQLKRFEWCSGEIREFSDEAAFSSILSAPMLEYVKIDLPNIDFSDNAAVIARVERREILRNLKKFEMGIEKAKIIYEDEIDFSKYLKKYRALNNAIVKAISA